MVNKNKKLRKPVKRMLKGCSNQANEFSKVQCSNSMLEYTAVPIDLCTVHTGHTHTQAVYSTHKCLKIDCANTVIQQNTGL